MNSIKSSIKSGKKAEKSAFEAMIGKPVIVRANVSGVHFGILESVDAATQTAVLTDAYRLWRVYTRDASGSISDVAAHGLKAPLSLHSVGAKIARVAIVNPQGLEIAQATDEAYKSAADASSKG